MIEKKDNGLKRCVLNAGSGSRQGRELPPPFHRDWREVTLDVDPSSQPDYVASLSDMRDVFADATFDAVWSSHSLEHIYGFELPAAFQEFRRVLKPGGFALVTCPDIEAVAAAVVQHGLDHVAYIAPAGPITLHDILYGHTPSIQDGASSMAHRTGLTANSLGKLAIEAGFAEACVGRGDAFDLWGVLLLANSDRDALAREFAGSPAAFVLSESRT